jgi:branched-subunit amino acid transport protein AzlD
MKTSLNEALILSAAMACAVFFCRIFPFLFFRGKSGNTAPGKRASGGGASGEAFLSFVEKTVPPVAMTVLAFNSLTDFSYLKIDFLGGAVNAILVPRDIIATISAAAFTALVHLWRRNPLISIFGGTALYMALMRII